MDTETGNAAAWGLVAGAVYFAIGEGAIPRATNCTYLAAPLTDLLAWGAGAWLMARGVEEGDPGLAFFGGALSGIHVSQFAAHKVGRRG